MKYVLVFLFVLAGGSGAYAQVAAQVCPVTMDGKQFYDAGGRLKIKSPPRVICPICVAKGTCGNGQVLVQSTILTDGSQTDISIVENTYNQEAQSETASAALKEASETTYEAPTMGGRPVCVKRLIRFNWVRE